MTAILPFPIGTATQDARYASDLGKIYFANGKAYRVARAAAAIAAAASKVVVTAVSSGVRTWVCNTTTTANNSLVAGTIPAGQVGSDGSTGLLINDYFLVQVSGDATCITITASTAIGTGLVTTTTAGSADPVSATHAATTEGAIFAILTATSVAGASTVRLVNLI